VLASELKAATNGAVDLKINSPSAPYSPPVIAMVLDAGLDGEAYTMRINNAVGATLTAGTFAGIGIIVLLMLVLSGTLTTVLVFL
jgi:hypothetical protein